MFGDFLTAMLVAVITFAVDVWLVMLGVGWLHSYYHSVPAIGFGAAAALTFIVKIAASQPQATDKK